MITRHAQAGFAGGALVFPGGKVDRSDAALAERLPVSHLIDGAHRIAAVRETYEECGLLLGRRPGSPDLVPGKALPAVPASGGAHDFASALATAAIEPAIDKLVPFAHWITPRHRPKRFDTLFFLALAPPNQVARHDGREAVDARWITPAAALAEAESGRSAVVFVTRVNLAKLGRSRTAAEALDAARREVIITVEPEPFTGPAGPMFRIPAAAGYDGTEFPIAGIPLG